ncbi:hypothetical protein [Ramlibacter pallidus]|uniref:Uncharacterized protein n=1 Tax=Ramlibacter pallidus TaxID=2780087 RepID=A0ABR9S2B8_9BURK|nr:hypothetical protein [Ramlibacter pallidus]MBE7367623.1 hypothetical protein [Ramlibacter pallidus]
MAAAAQHSLISQAVRALPGPLLSLLDHWSHRVAQRRAAQRQRLWLQEKAGPQTPAATPPYRLQPWRD